MPSARRRLAAAIARLKAGEFPYVRASAALPHTREEPGGHEASGRVWSRLQPSLKCAHQVQDTLLAKLDTHPGFLLSDGGLSHFTCTHSEMG